MRKNIGLLQNMKCIYALISIAFFCYAFVRAIYVPLTYDEVYTVISAIKSWEWVFDVGSIANNHFINSLLIKIFFIFFDDSIFVSRLPNVLAFIVFLFYSYRICYRYLPRFIGVLCFLLLLCNPFLIEYFSLARGYGLSLAFMMASLYYGLKTIESYSVSRLSKSLIWGAFSVLSIFSMIYFWGVLLLVLNVYIFLKEGRDTIKKSLVRSSWIALSLFVLIFIPIFRLIRKDKLHYGGTDDIYTDTFLSLTKYTLYFSDAPSPQSVLTVFSCFFGLIVLISFFYTLKKKQVQRNIFVGILLGVIISLIIGHYVVHIRYPLDRNALFFYPLIVFTFVFCVLVFTKYLQWSVLAICTTCLMLHFFNNFSIRKSRAWEDNDYERTRVVLHELNKKGQCESKVQVFDSHWIYHQFSDYIIHREHLTFVKRQLKDPQLEGQLMRQDTDYYINNTRIDKLEYEQKKYTTYDGWDVYVIQNIK